MNLKSKARLIPLVFELPILVLLVTGCARGYLPWMTASPAPTSTATPGMPTSAPAPCCMSFDFPPICGIIPGQSTIQDVEQVLGVPLITLTPTSGGEIGDIPAKGDTDTVAIYTCVDTVHVYFSDGIVSVVRYFFRPAQSLGEAVALYGPPEKVLMLMIYEDERPEEYEVVSLLWSAEGVAIDVLLPRPIEDPHEVPPFRAALPLDITVWYFQPTSLEQVVSTYPAREVLIDWPGMRE